MMADPGNIRTRDGSKVLGALGEDECQIGEDFEQDKLRSFHPWYCYYKQSAQRHNRFYIDLWARSGLV